MSWYLAAAIAAVVLLAVVSRRGESPRSRTRSGALPPSAERIDEFIRAGKKINAIKEYRAMHGVDLKTAKDAVESRARDLGR